MPPIGILDEWTLQKQLTLSWQSDGLSIGGQLHYLVAWEVMPNWHIKDYKHEWAAPSLDFLFADRAGRLLCVELKAYVAGGRDVQLALAQVTSAGLLRSNRFRRRT